MEIAGFGFRHVKVETINRHNRNVKLDTHTIRHTSELVKLGI